MKALDYIKPKKEEDVLRECASDKNVVVGGGMFLKSSEKEYNKIIDLEHLKLNYIKEVGNVIRIGAYATLRDVEISELMNVFCDGILSRCCEVVCGVQHRNIATIGGTVAGRYGFSDIIPALVVLNAKVNFLDGSSVLLEDYLMDRENLKIIKEVEVRKVSGRASFKCVKNTSLDFSVVNVCTLRVDGDFRIAVGARPGIAKRCPSVEQYLNINDTVKGSLIRQYLNKDISFGSNQKASKEYRESVCGSLIIESLKEVK